MQKFYKEISNDTGMAVYGLNEVQKALDIGAVDTLILSEKLDTYKVKVECSNCGYNESRIAKESDLNKLESSIQSEICPKCSSNSFSISNKITTIEELGQIAETVGTDVIIISPQTEEGEALYSTFGGIVGILRFKLTY
jgi:peptide chain release factor subunit 1